MGAPAKLPRERRDVPTVIYLTVDFTDFVKAYARRHGKSLSALARDALVELLKKENALPDNIEK